MKLASVRIVTHDVPALAAFYSAITGISPKGDKSYSEIPTASCTLAIVNGGVMEKLHFGHLAAAAANRSVILEFAVDDVDDLHVKLLGLVTDWVQEPKTMPWGNRSMLFRDPDGNLINFYTKLPQAN
jgi:catechol 2,3-dioxygenase-like lactoylglutathione lyase family enzyme